MREEIVDDVRARFPEHGRPADDLELVPVAGADGVGAVLYEKSDDSDMLLFGSEMERHRIVAVVSDVRISAAIEQQSHRGFVASAHREMERRAFAEMPFEIPACADDSRICIEQFGDARDIAASGRVEQRDERVLLCVEVL